MTPTRRSFLLRTASAALFAAGLATQPALAADPIKIGLITALSGESARACLLYTSPSPRDS